MLKVKDVAALAASEDLVLIEFYPTGGYLIGEDWGTNLPDDELVVRPVGGT